MRLVTQLSTFLAAGSLLVCQVLAVGDSFMCVKGDENSSMYYREILTEEQSQKCEGCICKKLLTQCLLGPDSAGNFETIDVDREFADTCDRSFCTCTTHDDFFDKANELLDEATRKLEQVLEV